MNNVISSFKGQYSFLSNFYLHTFEWQGIEWPTSEHAFQACKVDSQSEKLRISNLPTPIRAKRVGRSVELPQNWENMKIGYMAEILKAKFSNLWMQEALIETYPYELVEGNEHGDKFWGAVWQRPIYTVNAEPVWAISPVTLYHLAGQNELGKLLMKLREALL